MNTLILMTLADACDTNTCGFVAKINSLWSGLGVHVQIGTQLFLLLLVFWVLSRLFACKSDKVGCFQGCSCGCGTDCSCKKDN